MKKIECNYIEFLQIKDNKQIYKILNDIEDLSNFEEIYFVNEKSSEKLNVQITSIKKYSNINDVINIINYEKFGDYSSETDFINYFNTNYNNGKDFWVCRIKNLDNSIIDIKDPKILELINVNTIKKISIGMSGCQVYEVQMKDSNKLSILKIQTFLGDDSLVEEYNTLKFLKGKLNVADIYYYDKVGNNEYLLREYISAEPLYKFKDFGFMLGKELRKIHNLYSNNIPYKKFSTDNLLNNAIEKIDAIYCARNDKFKNFSKAELIKFLKTNKPKDDALIHGDFSLTNILKKCKKYYFIDLGNLSISTRYFDLYVLKKSLKINNLENEWEEILRGYGLSDLNDNYFDWMEFIELSYN